MKILGWTEDIAHEQLKITTYLFRFTPIPELEEAARTALLDIWDTLKTIDVSLCARRHACDAI